MDSEHELELGRNLAAAFIATSQGISLDYARKKYAAEPVGEYWIAFARMVTADLAKRSAQTTLPSTIQ